MKIKKEKFKFPNLYNAGV